MNRRGFFGTIAGVIVGRGKRRPAAPALRLDQDQRWTYTGVNRDGLRFTTYPLSGSGTMKVESSVDGVEFSGIDKEQFLAAAQAETDEAFKRLEADLVRRYWRS